MYTIFWAGGGEHAVVLHVLFVQQQLGLDTQCGAGAEQAAAAAQRVGELSLSKAISRRHTVTCQPGQECTGIPNKAGHRPRAAGGGAQGRR